MELYIQKFGKQKIVEVIGWNRKDAILKEFKSNFRFAVAWQIFNKYYEKIEVFDCDTSEYTGADLSNSQITEAYGLNPS